MSHVPTPTAASPNSVLQPARSRAEAIKFAWARGASPDTKAALQGDPDLLTEKSIVLDLAYEEYCLRREAGETPDPDDFCDHFPAYRSSLKRLLAAHQFLAENSDLLLQVPPIRWPVPGDTFGDFTLLSELGRGSFARVFLATEASTGDRSVALKLSIEGSSEAKTLGRLDHPNIVPILSARQDEGGLSLVCMPFLGSGTLHDVLDRAFPQEDSPPPELARVILDAVRVEPSVEPHVPNRPADPFLRNATYVDGVAHLGVQLAEALAFIHARGICHRDLKPSNVLLDPTGRPLLLDFNLSSDVRVSGSRAGGTLPYMAPEQVRLFASSGDRASAKSLDPRADLFSLGVVLFELFTGKNPFGPLPLGMAPEELARTLLERQLRGCRTLRTFNPAVDAELARLIEKCLAYAPEKRPVDATSLAEGLRRHFKTTARLRRWAGRRRGLVASLACATVLLLTAAGWSAATRDPLWAREYQQGRSAYLAGDFAEADQHFDRALTAKRDHAASWFGRGRTRLAQDEFTLAMICFDNSQRLRPDGATLAAMAYCRSRLRQHREAVVMADKAMENGFVTAEILNNRAYSLLRIGDLSNKVEADLKKALELKPDLLAAHYNRSWFTYLKWLQSPSVALPANALVDMRYVLDRAAPTADLYRDAFLIFAAASTNPADEGAQKAVEMLTLSHARGGEVADLANEPLVHLKKLNTNPGFQAIVRAPALQLAPRQVTTPRICDPIIGLPE